MDSGKPPTNFHPDISQNPARRWRALRSGHLGQRARKADRSARVPLHFRIKEMFRLAPPGADAFLRRQFLDSGFRANGEARHRGRVGCCRWSISEGQRVENLGMLWRELLLTSYHHHRPRLLCLPSSLDCCEIWTSQACIRAVEVGVGFFVRATVSVTSRDYCCQYSSERRLKV